MGIVRKAEAVRTGPPHYGLTEVAVEDSPSFHRSTASHDSCFDEYHSCRQLPDQPTGSGS